jgi:hypothetical protein
VYLKLLGDTHFGMYTSDGHAGMIVLCGHWRMGAAGPHSAGSRSPAPRLQQTGLVRISICGSRRVERPYGRPQPITPAAAPTADEWARPVDPASAPAQARTRPAAARQPRGSSRRAWAASASAAHGASNAPTGVHARPRPPPHRPPTSGLGLWTQHRHQHRPAPGRRLLASPAAPASEPGIVRHLRLTARRTPLRASTLAHAHRRTDRRRVGSACAPSIGTSKCPHPAGGCSPAPRRQRASLVSCGTFDSRSSRCIPRHPATSSDTRAIRIVRGSRGGRQCAQAAAGTRMACHGR